MPIDSLYLGLLVVTCVFLLNGFLLLFVGLNSNQFNNVIN